MPVSVSPSVYNIELLDLTCNIGYNLSDYKNRWSQVESLATIPV